MTNKEIAKNLWDATARIEQVIFLAGAVAQGDAIPDPLLELFDEFDEISRCFPDVPDFAESEGDARAAAESIADWFLMRNRLGFLVQVATPVMRKDGKHYAYSWGRYRTCWVYGDSMDEAVKAALAWVDDVRAKEQTNDD